MTNDHEAASITNFKIGTRSITKASDTIHSFQWNGRHLQNRNRKNVRKSPGKAQKHSHTPSQDPVYFHTPVHLHVGIYRKDIRVHKINSPIILLQICPLRRMVLVWPHVQ
jgi:hypothetical protein